MSMNDPSNHDNDESSPEWTHLSWKANSANEEPSESSKQSPAINRKDDQGRNELLCSSVKKLKSYNKLSLSDTKRRVKMMKQQTKDDSDSLDDEMMATQCANGNSYISPVAKKRRRNDEYAVENHEDSVEFNDDIASGLCTQPDFDGEMYMNDDAMDAKTPKRSGVSIPYRTKAEPHESMEDTFANHKDLSSDDEDDDESHESSILERRKKNIQRNQERLKMIGLLNSATKAKEDTTQMDKKDIKGEIQIETGNLNQKRYATGMLFASRHNGLVDSHDDVNHLQFDYETDSSQNIFEDFPHRRKQIRLLQSCFKNSVRQMDMDIEMDEYGNTLNPYIPSPVFVTGPGGTGKTDVLQRILNDLKRARGSTAKNIGKAQTNSPIGIAYIDCSTVEPYGSGASAILESSFTQLARQMDLTSKHALQLGNRGRANSSGSISLLSDGMSSLDSLSADDMSVDSSLDGDSVGSDSFNDDNGLDSVVGDEEDMLLNYSSKYKSKGRDIFKETKSKVPKISSNESQSGSRRSRRATRKAGQYKETTTAKSKKTKSYGPNIGALTTPAAFGRSISQFCGISEYNSFQRGCAFLVLDQAEKLLSFSNSKQKSELHTNFLSELLLLPKVMHLNLTVIVITNKMFVEQTRISNIEAPANKFGTIKEAICPISCSFDAYRSREVYRDLLSTRHMTKLVVGENLTTMSSDHKTLIEQLHRSLIDIVTQNTESITYDIREILRLVRLLWPIYLKPIKKMDSSRLSLTQSKNVDRNLLEELGQHLRPHMRQIVPRCMLRLGRTLSSVSDTTPTELRANIDEISKKLPYLTKFLLLAAYLCQTNKADQDRILYTNQRTGQRTNRGQGRKKASESETLTHASTQKSRQAMKLNRVVYFPLERLLSVYSSICNKYAVKQEESVERQLMSNQQSLDKSDELGTPIDVNSLGNISLLTSLSELRQHGFIRELSSNVFQYLGHTNLAYTKAVTNAKFTCTVTKKEAIAIAQTIHFPLQEYQLQHK